MLGRPRLSEQSEGYLSSCAGALPQPVCIWSPPLLSVNQWALQGFEVVSHITCCPSKHLAELAHGKMCPSTSALPLWDHCVCGMLCAGTCSCQPWEWGARGWAAGCSPAHSNCTSLCQSSSTAAWLEASLKYRWISFFLKTHTKSFHWLYRAIKTKHMEEYQWWLGWCKMIEV